MILKKHSIRKVVKPYRISKDLPEALDARILLLLEEAKTRAEANDRRTIKPCDL